MNGVLGAILPLAIAVTISPVPIIAEILLLFTRRPVATAGAYLAGFLVGVAAVLGILVLLANSIDVSTGGSSRGVAVAQLVLGVLLLVASVHKFRSRPAEGDVVPDPKWMQGISGFSPVKSFGLGAAIGAGNPKNVAVGVAAASAISSAGLHTGQTIVTVAFYVIVAGIGVAAPFVVTVMLRDRAQSILDRWKTWLSHNNAVVMAVLFLVFAVVLIGRGIAGL